MLPNGSRAICEQKSHVKQTTQYNMVANVKRIIRGYKHGDADSRA